MTSKEPYPESKTPTATPRAAPWTWLAALVAIAAITWLDHATGVRYSLALFYLLVLVTTGARLGRGAAAVLGTLASAGWFGADFLHRGIEELPLSLWNAGTRWAIFVAVGVLVAELLQDRERLRQLSGQLTTLLEREASLARTDALTGLPNRRAFLEALEREVARAQREGSHVAVAYIDVDNFKCVNDTRGHAAGDALLRGIADALSGSIRTEDVASRLGGDEFALLTAGGSLEVAEEIGKRFEERAAPLTGSLADCNVGVTFGISCSDAPGARAEDLLRRADEQMYRVRAEHSRMKGSAVSKWPEGLFG